MEIVKNGIVSIPLYHGTNSLFLDSIIKYGLGAINLKEKYRVSELIEDLFEFIEEQKVDLTRDGVLKFNKDIVEKMLNGSNSGFNFRHGSLYLTTHKYDASRYAKNNLRGGELLTNVLNLCDDISRMAECEFIPKQSIHKDLIEKHKKEEANSKPIVIKIRRGIKLEYLRDEYGEEVDLEYFNTEYTEKISESFEYLGTISANDLEIEYIQLTD